MREIKFRVWDKKQKSILSFDKIQETIPVKVLNHLQFEAMQYTGLKDKNGVEIYEGDIVLYDGFSGVTNGRPILWARGSFFIQARAPKYLGQTQTKKSIEVIGNIYENPELLSAA